uniref:Major facilitator superfamily (MFS) profile domain-containing protein n=1 Tax=Ciona savignyi TaxID=51511 RepID=H2YAZ0_CIOSA
NLIFQWQLQDQTWVTDMVQSLYFVGFLVGVVLFGQISDKIGRKKAMIIGEIRFCLTWIEMYNMNPNYTVFAVLRAATGMLVGGATLVMFIYTQELVSRDRWAVTSSLGAVQFAVGSIIMIVVSYYIPAWRMLYIALTVPQVIPLIFTWFVPESPRWLYSKGRLAEAEDILVMIARKNRVKDPVVCLVKKSVQETDASYSIIDLFKYKSTTKRVLLMAYNWFVCSFIAYSLTFAAGDMGKNQYINLFLSSVVELPMALLNANHITFGLCGRKRALAASLFISGVACFGLMAFSPGVKNSFKLSIGLGGKMAISCSFGIIYIYSPELFPTVVRNVSMGSLSMVSRFGGILASFAKTSVETNPKVAYLTFGLTGITSGLFSLFLPETLGTKPPDSFEDLE